jgi:hypothetical protein
MSKPVISPDDPERVAAVKTAWEDRLLANPNVTGVDIDLKMVGGQYVGTPSIVLYVAKKGVFAESDRIPATLDGVPTDVVEMEFDRRRERQIQRLRRFRCACRGGRRARSSLPV